MKMSLSGRLSLIGRGIFAQNPTSSDDPHKTVFGFQGATASLDHTEQTIYTSTVAARKDADGWISRESEVLKPLDIYNELKY
jgi:hypothetical protein